MRARGLGVWYLPDTEVITSSNLVGPIAVVVQLGERQTEDLDVAGSSPAHGTPVTFYFNITG